MSYPSMCVHKMLTAVMAEILNYKSLIGLVIIKFVCCKIDKKSS